MSLARAARILQLFPSSISHLTLTSPSSNIPGEPTPCLFSGILDGDQDSLVTDISLNGL